MSKRFTKDEVNKMLDLLKKAYPDAGCALLHGSAYELLVEVTLSAQTTDKSVNAIRDDLFSRYPDAFAMAKADQADIEKIIKRIGLYKTKSKRIIDQAKMLVSEFDGEVPENDEQLRKLPGVGRKTANVVMADAFGHQRIAVDTHVFRVSNRIGLASAKDVEKTEEQLKKILPKDRWTEAHHSLIFHGRNCCASRKPKCEKCPISDLCRYYAAQKK